MPISGGGAVAGGPPETGVFMMYDSTLSLWAGRCAVRSCAAAVVALTIFTGCGPNSGGIETGPGASAANAPLESNVIGVRTFVHSFQCWMWNEDHTEPVGIIIHALYLEGPNGKGVFGDGTIRPMLYAARWDQEGKRHWDLVKEWRIGPEEAIPFRSKKYNPVTGWGYRFDLLWGDELDLAGREIRLIVAYDRTDGLTVRSTKKDKKVPKESS